MFYVDVRSPAEYAHAHIPGACNLPLLSDAQRAQVGTLYKQDSPESAFEIALGFVAPKVDTFLSQATQFEPPFTLYCWRGGMRSQSLHKLFRCVGIASQALQGGYKAYRRHVLAFLKTSFPFRVLTGPTGSGKTERLHQLKEQGEQVLDLEALANHKGSVFGCLGAQPSNEQFENDMAYVLGSFSLEKPIWVENESRMIGSCKIPDPIYAQMREAPLTEVLCTEKEREARLLREYGSLSSAELIQGVLRLKKRLGEQRAKEIVETIRAGELHKALITLLPYYDRTYAFKKRRL